MKKLGISGLTAVLAVMFMVFFAQEATAAAEKPLPVTKTNIAGSWNTTLDGFDCVFSFLTDGNVKFTMTDGKVTEERAGSYTVKDKQLMIVWNHGEEMNFDVLTLTRTHMKLYEDFDEVELNLTRVIKK